MAWLERGPEKNTQFDIVLAKFNWLTSLTTYWSDGVIIVGRAMLLVTLQYITYPYNERAPKHPHIRANLQSPGNLTCICLDL